ncbi:putative flavoprotein [Schinkia azotoformans MEV2011]|uniref:Putative flavoprotein n=1 Tax=Schinkia azotoformans MEV2011 TaxID=1348973 RepID=A0A072NVC7_SCHAZ|nr:NAD(P)H-dependent oxidoreductase [Schinkia azotoformans]KEF37190.1 putative flavoprotein [Schinkia azotoformans MEV2011]MEC1695464.1 NAD(P)H-dependent oxidoreductase [Schinkia azotoformans]MEC1715467.1 NAD(P)H-dependent oxidoreductase [Schinkia azotoformans]MEC1725744.1 NAD(P)H-dependent oxidoreductase [Schinkia azotoformans]MEC1741803.1 NAD(P)H-dependent oxidoreductase [Schinkia azotoformans]
MGLLDKIFGKPTKEEEAMTTEKLNIGIILGSTRQGRVSPQVGEWVMGIANKRGDANFEIVDIADYNLPFLGTTDGTEPGIAAWNEQLASLDGFVFIVQEYNHSITGALKNAIDFAREAWYNKAAGIVSYGSTGGARAAEHLRGILAEQKVADVRTHPTLSLFTDFVNGTEFKPQELHQNNVNTMLDEVIAWSGALKIFR